MSGFIPKGYVTFKSAVEIVAEHLHGKELVPPLTADERDFFAWDRDLKNEAEREGAPWDDEDPDDAPELIALRKKGGTRYRQIRDAENELRQLLWEGKITAQVITQAGPLHDIPSTYWGTPDFHKVRQSGVATVLGDSGNPSGQALIVQEQLERVLNTQENAEDPVLTSTRIESLSPYLQLMIKASQSLALSKEGRVKKDEVKRWLKEKWPAQKLGNLTKNKLESMATLLRFPEHEKGGRAWPKRVSPTSIDEGQRKK